MRLGDWKGQRGANQKGQNNDLKLKFSVGIVFLEHSLFICPKISVLKTTLNI
jgi:hypothetical protein